MLEKNKMNNKELAHSLKKNYSIWKKDSLDSKGYFIIFNGFRDTNKLKTISGNALKLYIYLGFYSNNTTGEVWHGNKRISVYFHRSERTIRSWMQELESLNLVKRIQLEFNKESHTFLQPYYSSDSLCNSEKYVYRYRLKNSCWREQVNLKDFESDIKTVIISNIKNSYIKITPSYFQITSFYPIETKFLRSLGKEIKKSIPEFENYTKVYSYKRPDGSIATNYHLFERIKNKSY